MTADWKIAPLEEPLDDYLALAGESLHFYDASIWETYVQRVGIENLRGVYSGDQLAGGLAFYRMGQWYGGRCVACAGLSGVAIDPGFRGSGACNALLTDWLQELHREKMPIAALYASTKRLYQKVGFEQSGHRLDYSIPMTSLQTRAPDRSLATTRIARPMPNGSKATNGSKAVAGYDVDQHIEVLKRVAHHRNVTGNGLLERTDGQWRRAIEPLNGRTTSTYFVGEPDAPAGYIILLHNDRSGGHPQTLTACDWAANTPAAMRRIVALILDHRSMCDRFSWVGGPQDPLLLMAAEERVEVTGQIRTMNRIVDVEAALRQRGYAAHLEETLQLQIVDALLPNNTGIWELRLKSGVMTVERIHQEPHAACGPTASSPPRLVLDIGALAPLYSSFMTCSQLELAGKLASQDPRAAAIADTIFAGPAPWTNDMF